MGDHPKNGGAAEMGTKKEKERVHMCQRLLAKLRTACISEKGSRRATLLNANVWTRLMYTYVTYILSYTYVWFRSCSWGKRYQPRQTTVQTLTLPEHVCMNPASKLKFRTWKSVPRKHLSVEACKAPSSSMWKFRHFHVKFRGFMLAHFMASPDW